MSEYSSSFDKWGRDAEGASGLSGLLLLRGGAAPGAQEESRRDRFRTRASTSNITLARCSPRPPLHCVLDSKRLVERTSSNRHCTVSKGEPAGDGAAEYVEIVQCPKPSHSK